MESKETKEKQVSGFGIIAEACRQVGVTRTVYKTAKTKKEKGDPLTRNEIAVLSKYKELIEQAEEQFKSL